MQALLWCEAQDTPVTARTCDAHPPVPTTPTLPHWWQEGRGVGRGMQLHGRTAFSGSIDLYSCHTPRLPHLCPRAVLVVFWLGCCRCLAPLPASAQNDPESASGYGF
jgi:hypothetical protein